MFVAGPGLTRPLGSPPVDIPAQIRATVAAGVDWIKMYGSTGSGSDVTGVQTFTEEEMKLAVGTAHSYGKRIAIHSYGVPGAIAALAALPESIEHPAGVPDDILRKWADTDVYYVPTIDHNRYYSDNADLLGYPAAARPQLDSFVVLNLETTRRAHAAGVKIAMGSDVVQWGFGENTPNWNGL
jgi:imidazolonepropionase-like amidohydrolase